MNGLLDIIKDHFSAFVEAMLFISSELQIWNWYEAALLVIILGVALGVIFLCDHLMRKYNLGFPASVLLAFLILSLSLGLTGILLSIPRFSVSAFDTFLVVFIGSPVFNIALGVMASWGSRLRKINPIAGTLILCGAGFLFSWILLTTFIMFVFRVVTT